MTPVGPIHPIPPPNVCVVSFCVKKSFGGEDAAHAWQTLKLLGNEAVAAQLWHLGIWGPVGQGYWACARREAIIGGLRDVGV